jgi:hypothetical protein
MYVTKIEHYFLNTTTIIKINKALFKSLLVLFPTRFVPKLLS